MSVKIADIMARRVVTAQPHHTIEHVQGLLTKNRIHAIPIVGPDHEPVGIVTTADLVNGPKPGTPVNRVMTEEVRKVPAYNDADVAARIMRRNKIHHVVVTHEGKVVGIVSSLDLLKLVEGRSYVTKDTPNKTRKKT